jgi:hypothetical protein
LKDNLSHPTTAEVKNVHSFTSTPAYISVPWWLGQEANLPLAVSLVYRVISTNKVFNFVSTDTDLYKLTYSIIYLRLNNPQNKVTLIS